MAQRRRVSNASVDSAPVLPPREQELSSMYDYLAKVILLGPSGCGKSCILHRFVKDEWRMLSSQTVGVEFATKIVKVGTGARRKRIKLQLWDTAGTERFRSVTRSYYRGTAGLLLIYDITSHATFRALPTFLSDARALASPHLTVLLAGNKSDATSDPGCSPPSSTANDWQSPLFSSFSSDPTRITGLPSRTTATIAPDGRDVSAEEAAAWAQDQNILLASEVSALTGDGIDELFLRLAGTILTRIELGEIDPSDPHSGIQYGDTWNDGGGSTGSVVSDGYGTNNLRATGRPRGNSTWRSGMREWEEVFRLDAVRRRERSCC